MKVPYILKHQQFWSRNHHFNILSKKILKIQTAFSWLHYTFNSAIAFSHWFGTTISKTMRCFRSCFHLSCNFSLGKSHIKVGLKILADLSTVEPSALFFKQLCKHWNNELLCSFFEGINFRDGDQVLLFQLISGVFNRKSYLDLVNTEVLLFG